QLKANQNVWRNVCFQVAERGYNDTSARVGIKWQF
ncbi:type V secretion protein A, partial [Escherichia coli]